MSQIPFLQGASNTAAHAPGPRDLRPFGSLTDIQRDALGTLVHLHRCYGDVVRHRIGMIPTYLITHPEGIKHVLQDNTRNYTKHALGFALIRQLLGDGLLTSSGEHWLRQRRLIQPAFHRQQIAGFADLMVRATQAQLDGWPSNGATLDVAKEMMRLTLTIVCATLFTSSASDKIQRVDSAFTQLNTQIAQRARSMNPLPPVLPTPADRRFRAALATLNEVVYEIIAERRTRPTANADLLGMLMDARDAETNQTMNDTQLRDEVLTMLLAGHETTAVALSWVLALLAQHPTAEAKLRAELDRVLGGRAPSLADLPQLAYTRMVFDEALRLYPPLSVLGRRAVHTDVICGYQIPHGAMVVISPYLMHRHPAFWPEPERFLPERFAPEQAKERPRFAYLPFSGGPRQCIGNTFAQMEGTLILATLLQRFQLSLAPGQQIEPELLLTLRPKHGLPMLVERR